MPEKQHGSIKYINVHLDTVYKEMKAITEFVDCIIASVKVYQEAGLKLKSRVSL